MTDGPVAGEPPAEHEQLHDVVRRLEALLGPAEKALQPAEWTLRRAEKLAAPAWRGLTDGESRVAVSCAVIVAIALQLAIPDRLVPGPRWLLPGIQAALFIGLVIANPRRITRTSQSLRATSIALIAVASAANAWEAINLIRDLVSKGETDAGALLFTGAAVWITNIIVFALWYWDLDGGGAIARERREHEFPDFLFPQQADPSIAPKGWGPTFIDYFYLSFTNATAFSPTDVMPLARWAKLTMLVQSAISLATVGLVIARAVNILR